MTTAARMVLIKFFSRHFYMKKKPYQYEIWNKNYVHLVIGVALQITEAHSRNHNPYSMQVPTQSFFPNFINMVFFSYGNVY